MPAIVFCIALEDSYVLGLYSLLSIGGALAMALLFAVGWFWRAAIDRRVGVKATLAWYCAAIGPLCGVFLAWRTVLYVEAYQTDSAFKYCHAVIEELERRRGQLGAYPPSIEEVERRLALRKPALVSGRYYMRVDGGYLVRFRAALSTIEGHPRYTWDSRKGDWLVD